MDTSKKAESAHLLDDLESIRQLLGDDSLQPPLLTDTVHREGQIPLLFDVVGNRNSSSHDDDDVDEEPKLKYSRLTRDLGPVYRNGDATATFMVAGDKMVRS